ncbi:MAG: hypothetical protein FJ261_06945 [Planctomycetes bacterium]|nr:hypothetical protein [Planctomycetota bacterium]
MPVHQRKPVRQGTAFEADKEIAVLRRQQVPRFTDLGQRDELGIDNEHAQSAAGINRGTSVLGPDQVPNFGIGDLNVDDGSGKPIIGKDAGGSYAGNHLVGSQNAFFGLFQDVMNNVRSLGFIVEIIKIVWHGWLQKNLNWLGNLVADGHGKALAWLAPGTDWKSVWFSGTESGNRQMLEWLPAATSIVLRPDPCAAKAVDVPMESPYVARQAFCWLAAYLVHTILLVKTKTRAFGPGLVGDQVQDDAVC